MTNVEMLVGKKLTMEVCEGTVLNVEVVGEDIITYQFVGIEDGTSDDLILSALEIKYDDIEDAVDHCFTTEFGSTYFLHQFDEVEESTESLFV